MYFGKAHVTIQVEGCRDCGTRWSSNWLEVEVIPVKIGNQKGVIRLHLCADCIAKDAARPKQLDMFEQVEE